MRESFSCELGHLSSRQRASCGALSSLVCPGEASRFLRFLVIANTPQDRGRSRRREGLPGCWAILFMRAVVQHPAGLDPSSPQLLFEKIYAEVAIAFAKKKNARHPE